MKILVTGSAGFIGFHLVKSLLKKGFLVVGVDNLNNYYDSQLKIDRLLSKGININKLNKDSFVDSDDSNYRFYKCNLEDENKLKKIFSFEKFEAVCHLAAQAGVRYSLENPNAYITSNIVGFQNIIDLCKDFEVDNFSFASSSSVYGANSKLPFSTSDRVDHPLSLYAATKKSN